MPASISEAFTSPLNKSKSEQGGYNDVLSKYFPSIDKQEETQTPKVQKIPTIPTIEKHEQLTENIREEINQSPYAQVAQRRMGENRRAEQQGVENHKGVEHRHMDYYGHQGVRSSVHEDCHDQIASILACPYCRSKLRALLSDEQPSLPNQTGGNPLSTIMSGGNSEMVNLFLIVGMVIIIHKLFLSK